MKKLLFVLSSILLLAACSKDDDNTKEPYSFIGKTWKQIKYTFNGEDVNSYYYQYIHYSEDGSLSVVTYNNDNEVVGTADNVYTFDSTTITYEDGSIYGSRADKSITVEYHFTDDGKLVIETPDGYVYTYLMVNLEN